MLHFKLYDVLKLELVWLGLGTKTTVLGLGKVPDLA